MHWDWEIPAAVGAFIGAIGMLLGGISYLRRQTRNDAVSEALTLKRIQLLEDWKEEHRACHEMLRRSAEAMIASSAAVEAKVDILLARK